jgi:hypothetical protein
MPESVTVALRLAGALLTRYRRYRRRYLAALPHGVQATEATVLRSLLIGGLDHLEDRK